MIFRLLPLLVILYSHQVAAMIWPQLWHNSDQRGLAALSKGQAEEASALFQDPQWRATALYRAGKYQEAAQIWQHYDNSSAHYNRGNALARSGQLEQAKAAYQKALQQEPDHQDAKANLALIDQLQQQQESKPEEKAENEKEDQSDAPEQNSPNDIGQNNDSQRQGENTTDSADDLTQGQGQEQEQEQEQSQEHKQDEDQAQQDAAAENSPEVAQLDNDADTSSQDKAQVEQWLRSIPDDPAELLRRKFLLERAKRQRQGMLR